MSDDTFWVINFAPTFLNVSLIGPEHLHYSEQFQDVSSVFA